MDVEEVFDQLYSGAPAAFTALRDDLAKQARADGDAALAKRIGALRRPTVSAFLVNRLVRSSRDEVEQLLDLGDALREAQSALEGEALRALSRQRHQVVAALGKRATRDLPDGVRVTADALRETEQTLEAAMADPALAEQLRAGTITKPLTYAGFGTTQEPSAALAASAPTPSRNSLDRSAKARVERKAQQEALERAERAERERREAEWQAALDRATAQRDEARAAHDGTLEKAAAAEAELDVARAALERAEQAAASAREVEQEARMRQAHAEEHLEEASRRLRAV